MSLRGDAHKLYRKLKNFNNNKGQLERMKELKELEEIRSFYTSIDTFTLKLIYYRMIKEKSGSGIIPILVTSIPWFFFLFSKQLQEFLFKDGSLLWAVFSVVYLVALSLSVIIHFREKAWAGVHIEIIQDIIKERQPKNNIMNLENNH